MTRRRQAPCYREKEKDSEKLSRRELVQTFRNSVVLFSSMISEFGVFSAFVLLRLY